MFTGIIQQVGRVESIERTPSGVRIVVDPRGWEHTPRPGESIANNGCCLTLVDPVDRQGGLLSFDAIPETLAKTTLGSWKQGERVNLERALRMGDTLDGHQVQGHVDGTGSVLGVFTDDGWRVRVGLGEELMRYMVPKGSVCLDGVSLTIAAMDAGAGWIEVALIPETLERTNLRERAVGDRVNIECDVLVKSIVHTLERMELKR
ncbi:MAG: riboflavin synthase [Phycisphaerales bacterium]